MDPKRRAQIQTVWHGRRFRAVHKTLHWRPPEETFHEFIVELLKLELGKDWFNSEKTKLPAEQHQIMRWIHAFARHKREHTDEAHLTDRPGRYESDAPGGVWSLISLAYDVYQLKHTGNICPRTIARLKKREAFQGARYEIAAAAIFARSGFVLEYPPAGLQTPHPEFVAVDPESDGRIAVEAKSRRRSGVLHELGEMDPERITRGDAAKLLRKALTQVPDDIPSAIFIDLNALPTPGVPMPEKRWVEDVKQMISRLPSADPTRPDPFNALFITNYAFHYADTAPAAPIENITVFAKHVRQPFPREAMSRIHAAASNYGKVPDDEE